MFVWCNISGCSLLSTGIPQTDIELIAQQQRGPEHQLYEKISVGGGQAPLQQPKQVMVACSVPAGSSNYRSSAVTDHELQFPDVIQQQPVTATTKSPKKATQPLNPAALVQVPPSPPLQFPHQFPHLIHTSRQAGKPTPPPPPAR